MAAETERVCALSTSFRASSPTVEHFYVFLFLCSGFIFIVLRAVKILLIRSFNLFVFRLELNALMKSQAPDKRVPLFIVLNV